MEITINRKRTNRLYTEGELRVNRTVKTYTVEATSQMLQDDVYELKVHRKDDGTDDLVIYKDNRCLGVSINIGHSWIDSRKKNVICIGQPIIEGALYRCKLDNRRLRDGIRKCLARNGRITLRITSKNAIRSRPVQHWMNRFLG